MILWTLDPAHRDDVRRMADAAQATTLRRFEADAWVDRLLELAERVAGARG